MTRIVANGEIGQRVCGEAGNDEPAEAFSFVAKHCGNEEGVRQPERRDASRVADQDDAAPRQERKGAGEQWHE